MKFAFIIFCFFSLSINLSAEKRFEFTPLAQDAYDKVMSLRFEEARYLLTQLKTGDPDNLIRYHIENYIDFFTVYIRENREEFERLEKNKDARIEAIKQGNESSPYYLYLQANIRLHWALARLKFEEYFSAFTEVNKAFKLLSKNQQKFPDFMPNKKDLGILHAMVGTIPDNYKWGVELLTSLNGTIDQGRSEIEEVLKYSRQTNFIYEQETLVLYAYLLMYLDNDGDMAWKILQSGRLNPSDNPLSCFTLANIAMRTGRNDEAIQILKNRPQGSQFFPFPYLDFMLGNAMLRKLDAQAHVPLQRFIRSFKGRHFIKEAYQKLSWHALIKGDLQKYFEYRELCKNKGYTVVESDKNALEEAKQGTVPDVALLKARLLFDGGYYQRAYKTLASVNSGDFKDTRSRLEFTYRMGRILHKLDRANSAIRFYQETIDEGYDKSYYFACNAALQMGLLFEELDNYSQARNYFRKCLDIHPDDYQVGLHQQAKAGLERVTGKKN